MTRTEEELRKEYEEYSRMYNNPKHWEGWLIDEIGRVENYLEEVRKLAEFLTIEAGRHSKRCKELECDTEILEPKAEAYDRLMSGGKKTPKEVANFLGKPVAVDSVKGVSRWFWYDEVPTFVSDPEWQFCGWTSTKRLNELPEGLIEYHGNWEGSLTLPDGWEALV